MAAGEKNHDMRVLKRNLYKAELVDGSELSIGTSLVSLDKPQETDVHVLLCAENLTCGEQEKRWRAEKVTSLHFTPETKQYYALVNVADSRIFIFFLWNGRHCTIDKKTGVVLARGEGDGALEQFSEFIPLKLVLPVPATFEYVTGEKAKELIEEFEKRERASPVVLRIQAIPASSMKKFYVVCFDTFWDPRPGSKREPVAVMAWKGHETSGVAFNVRKVMVAINGHRVTPSPRKKAIYVVGADYSLKQLSMSEKEISRLFAHIVRSEERAVSGSELKHLPLDETWERDVDRFLNVVEPPRKDDGKDQGVSPGPAASRTSSTPIPSTPAAT
jgi:hypothetical protein